jgi:rare lipoprotein A
MTAGASPAGSRDGASSPLRTAGLLALVAATMAVAGCGTAPKPPAAPAASAPAARPGAFYQHDGPPLQVPADIVATPDAVPRIEPFHSGAARPYVALGRSYTPVVDDRPIVQRGYASWYGRQFHGNRTSNGEIYDMFAMTAAHPTMPLPSYARVTNLRSGASVVVRVNDRGPFKDARIIDLSYAAAAKLGIAATGTGEVEVRRITHAEIAAASGTAVAAAPASGAAASATVPAPAASAAGAAGGVSVPAPAAPVAAAGTTTANGAAEGRFAVQLGAFRQEDNARALHEQMARALATDALIPAELRLPRLERDGEVHRVLLGWLADRQAAADLAARLALLLGRDTAVVVR